ncbi:MAG: hypothetical protein CMB98_00075 [Flavobacteriaceae bacterium]|nr:hypothetical protein [Flavobacteriaceae bacterium]
MINKAFLPHHSNNKTITNQTKKLILMWKGKGLKNNICINNNYIYNITFFITLKSFVLIILTYTPIIFTNNSIISLTIM